MTTQQMTLKINEKGFIAHTVEVTSYEQASKITVEIYDKQYNGRFDMAKGGKLYRGRKLIAKVNPVGIVQKPIKRGSSLETLQKSFLYRPAKRTG